MDQELKNSIMKTGTSIFGIVCKDGIIIAGDRQTTAGNVVMSKKTPKVRKVNDYILGAWCGVSSDAQRLSKLIAAELKLKQLRSKSRPTVKQAANLFATMSYSGIRQPSMIPMQVGSLVGGINEDGKIELYTIEPAGGIMEVTDYDANFGSGMPYILGLLERQYKKDMTIEEGIELAKESLKSSTQRDTGSGYGMDIFSITKEGIKKEFESEI